MVKTADVVVIGAGVVGCSVAYYLAREGVNVTLLEREAIGSGASAHATGSLSPNPPMDTDGRREDTGRGGEGVTGAMIRARIRVDGRLAGGLQALLGRRWRPAVAVASEMAG